MFIIYPKRLWKTKDYPLTKMLRNVIKKGLFGEYQADMFARPRILGSDKQTECHFWDSTVIGRTKIGTGSNIQFVSKIFVQKCLGNSTKWFFMRLVNFYYVLIYKYKICVFPSSNYVMSSSVIRLYLFGEKKSRTLQRHSRVWLEIRLFRILIMFLQGFSDVRNEGIAKTVVYPPTWYGT